MRVGFFTLRIDERPTGLANYTQQLTYGLRNLDEDVEVYLLNPHPWSNLEWYREFPMYPLCGVFGSRSYAAATLAAPVELGRAVGHLKLDIVHAPGNVAPFIGPKLGAQRVAPFSMWRHWYCRLFTGLEAVWLMRR